MYAQQSRSGQSDDQGDEKAGSLGGVAARGGQFD